jgi:hypothetical protein
MLLVLCVFIAVLVFLGFLDRESLPKSLPKDSFALSSDLVKNLSGSAIPSYVLINGTIPDSFINRRS